MIFAKTMGIKTDDFEQADEQQARAEAVHNLRYHVSRLLNRSILAEDIQLETIEMLTSDGRITYARASIHVEDKELEALGFVWEEQPVKTPGRWIRSR